jgi:CRISPR/Cas system-associated exonuclease Cas4 (RecB family)
MQEGGMVRVLISPSGAERLEQARGFVESFPRGTEILLLGASREAADELSRAIGVAAGATFGLYRFTLLGLAARLAMGDIAREGLAHGTGLGAEAIATRAVFEADGEGALDYFEPVARYPNFARAVSATVGELRAARTAPAALEKCPPGTPGADLRMLMLRWDEQLACAKVADRAVLFSAAARALHTEQGSWLRTMPILLLDVALGSRAELEMVAQMVQIASDVLATVPLGDERTARALLSIGAVSIPARQPRVDSPLDRLHHYLFSMGDLPRAGTGETVSFFSAPGEGRECVEIARRIQEEARRGVRFDEMAVFVRAPEIYAGLLESALRRAGVPGYFAFGATRPDPSGRAFLALLSCRAEGLSARRFAEYLSLGQVPPLNAGAPPSGPAAWVAPDDEALGLAADAWMGGGEDDEAAGDGMHEESESLEAPAAFGTLRVPRQWERLLVEASVIGGRKDRWERRLKGLEAAWKLQQSELVRDDPESPRLDALRRDLAHLRHLSSFAIPVIDVLAAFPVQATWGRWLEVLRTLASMVLRCPEPVLKVLAELCPMAEVGPVGLDEVIRVLTPRLGTVERARPRHRYGRVFIARPEQARGRTFSVVFVPGLAERLFPQKPREDPILLDIHRKSISEWLATQADRGLAERLLLRLSVGAATERVHLSYPRLEIAESRPRVPSFYGLDVVRAVTGIVPDYETLQRDAAGASNARLAWPAPADPARAIDDAEHDLATLGRLLHAGTGSTKWRAQYLLDLNPHLARSLRTRWARWHSRQWSSHDGLVGRTTEIEAALQAARLQEKPYSVSALQRFAACPYRFFLSAVLRLAPRQEPVAVEQMDSTARGILLHRVQAEVLQTLKREGTAVTPASHDAALEALDQVLHAVAQEYEDRVAPPIPRVWKDEVKRLRADLQRWLMHVIEESKEWIPVHTELGFGLLRRDAGSLDPESVEAPAVLSGKYQLHGAIDLLERNSVTSLYRVTDTKTGANTTSPGMVIGGGETLQPVLYSLAVEQVWKTQVVDARLSFCTSRGEFTERVVPLTDETRREGLFVLDIIDRAIGAGFFPPLPREGACERCDYRAVCGPHEQARARRKDNRSFGHRAPLDDLIMLRRRP